MELRSGKFSLGWNGKGNLVGFERRKFNLTPTGGPKQNFYPQKRKPKILSTSASNGMRNMPNIKSGVNSGKMQIPQENTRKIKDSKMFDKDQFF